MNSRLLFTLIYLPLIIVVGELIHRQGRTVLRHAFGDTSAVATAVSMLLRFGWYLTSLGLLLWNLGVQTLSGMSPIPINSRVYVFGSVWPFSFSECCTAEIYLQYLYSIARTSNHAIERTADRCAFTFEMTSTLPLRATRALVRRRSSCSR